MRKPCLLSKIKVTRTKKSMTGFGYGELNKLEGTMLDAGEEEMKRRGAPSYRNPKNNAKDSS